MTTTLPCSLCGEPLTTKEEAVEHMQEEHDYPGGDVVFVE